MKSQRRQLGGIRAKRAGESWEKRLQSAAWKATCAIVPILMGCKQIGRGKLIRVRNPFDFALVRDGQVVFMDAKTTLEGTFTHSSLTPHQVDWLGRTHSAGCMSGYVVEFRKLGKVSFFSHPLLANLKRGEGLKPEQGIMISDDQGTLHLKRLFRESSEETKAPGVTIECEVQAE